jgi:hypothetical protein
MRAAPGRAAAPRVIARKSQRADITFALVMTKRSCIKVKAVLSLTQDRVVLAEEPHASQDEILPRQV